MKSNLYSIKKRSCYLVSAALLTIILGLLSCSQHPPPNVLLIVVDDLGYADMSCTGLAEDVKTPHIDRLAESGIRFTQAYATSPICSPSRAGIITGCYQERWGTYWYGGRGIHDPAFLTLAEVARDQGYRTGYIGKVHYGGNDADTNDRSFPLNHGFQYYFGHTSARKHYLIHHSNYEREFQRVKSEYNRAGQSLRKQGLWENTSLIDTLAYSTPMFANKACEFIREHKNDKFFLQLAFNAVHNFTHQLPVEYLKERNLMGYYDWDPATEEYYDWYRKGRYPNNPEGRAHYLGQLHFLDRAIGQVLDCLDEAGIEENTLVVFVSDNGGSTPIYANNYPLRGSKYILNEGGIRVPVIYSFPARYTSGVVSENVISALDILPTICRAMRIQPPGPVDGIDLSVLLTGADSTLCHDTLAWDTQQEVAVRAGKWKYHLARTNAHATYEMVELDVGEFLYDLDKDPGENNNLASEYPEIVTQLKDYHKRWLSSMAPSTSLD